MKSAENIEKLIKNLDLDIDINTKTDRVILGELSEVHEKSKKMKSALAEPNIRRTIMKSPITKLAAAAVIIIAVLISINQFSSPTTSIAWGEVAKKVEASRGVICRGREIALDSRDGGPDYTMNYLSNTKSRHDSYKGDHIIKTFYDDYDTKNVVFIDHGHKSYIKKTFEQMNQNDLWWRDPKSLVQRFLSHEHRELGPKTVEGVLCEGIETTDPTFDEANFPVDSLLAQVWVSVETSYPILLEFEVTRIIGDNEKVHIKAIMDHFQWDVELDESIFEPNIPPDYMQIPMP